MQTIDFRENIRLTAAAFITSRYGHYAVSTAVAATVLDLDETAMPTTHQQCVRRLDNHSGNASAILTDQLQGLFDQLLLILVIDHQVDAQAGFYRLWIKAGVTTGDHQASHRVTALQSRDLLTRFTISLCGHRAGVEHHDIGFLRVGSDLMPALHELIGPGFQLGFVQPASERLEIDVHVNRRGKIWRILTRNQELPRIFYYCSSCRRFSRALEMVVGSASLETNT